MENVLSDQDDLANPPPFWCHICRISCASAINLHSHFLGSRHKKAEEALKNNQEGGGDQPKAVESLEEQINACKNAEPALGLEYIYEFQNHGYSRYECRLCNCFLGRTHMFLHIVGARHRIYYLSKHHPSMGITNAYILKGPKKLKKLRDICVRVEKEFGRKQINVVKGDFKMFSCNAQMPPPCVNYQVDSKLQDMDFTNDEFIDIEEKPTAEEHVTFLELKTAHDASLKDQAIGQNNLQQAAGQEKDHKENENKPDNSDSDIDTCDIECTNDLDAFPSNRELFQYLESFKVFELGDVHFLLKVSEKLRNALVCHKEDDVESNKMELNSNGQDEDINQSVVPSLEHCVTNHESECSNKKVSFRISGPSTEKKTLVSTPLLSHIQQDFQEQSFLSLNPRNRSTSITQHQLSKPPEKAGAAFGRGQFSKENMKGSSILTPSKSSSPLELTANSAGSVTTLAENIHEGFKNVSCFPSPIAPNTTEQTRNSSLFPPPRSPNAQESIRDFAGVAFPRPPNSKMFRNVAGSACFRTPNSYREIGSSSAPIHFRATCSNTAVRASPPVAKDDVTAKFFESIKDMEVSEVVSTLNKITATNPALQGIHVPSLVQYLMDTGKLKSSSNQEKK